MFERQLVHFTSFSLRLDGFSPIMKRKSFQDVPGPFSGPVGVDPNTYGRTSGPESAFCKITYALFDMLHDTI